MKNPLSFILTLFCTPTALQIAKRDLAEGQRKLLKYQEASDYHTQMVVFQSLTNARLSSYVFMNTPAPTPSPMQELVKAKVDSRRAPKLVNITP